MPKELEWRSARQQWRNKAAASRQLPLWSFIRNREIYPTDGGASIEASAPAHRLDEFPAGSSSSGLLASIARLRFADTDRILHQPHRTESITIER